MNANASRLAWPLSSLPPNTSLHPVLNYRLKTPSQIPWTKGQTETVPPSSNNFLILFLVFYKKASLRTISKYDVRVEFENYATLLQTPILTSKCFESHLRTFVNNQTTISVFLQSFPFVPTSHRNIIEIGLKISLKYCLLLAFHWIVSELWHHF